MTKINDSNSIQSIKYSIDFIVIAIVIAIV